MKIDRSKLKKSSSEVPADCKTLIDRLTSTTSKTDFLSQLQKIETWTYGKCELLHWIDVLDVCDDVLEAAAASATLSSSGPLIEKDAETEPSTKKKKPKAKRIKSEKVHGKNVPFLLFLRA